MYIFHNTSAVQNYFHSSAALKNCISSTVRYGNGKMSNEYFDEYYMQPFPLRIKGGDCNEIFSLLIPLTQKKLASKKDILAL
jgi:hypothetical protein